MIYWQEYKQEVKKILKRAYSNKSFFKIHERDINSTYGLCGIKKGEEM